MPVPPADMIAAMIQVAPGDVIEFDCGFFELSSALQLTDTEDVLIKGCGRDKTVLSFKQSATPEGILAVNVHGLWIEDLTVLDTGGNGIELRGVDHGDDQAACARCGRPTAAARAPTRSPPPTPSATTPSASTSPAPTRRRRIRRLSENQLLPLDTTSPDYTVSREVGPLRHLPGGLGEHPDRGRRIGRRLRRRHLCRPDQ